MIVFIIWVLGKYMIIEYLDPKGINSRLRGARLRALNRKRIPSRAQGLGFRIKVLNLELGFRIRVLNLELGFRIRVLNLELGFRILIPAQHIPHPAHNGAAAKWDREEQPCTLDNVRM